MTALRHQGRPSSASTAATPRRAFGRSRSDPTGRWCDLGGGHRGAAYRIRKKSIVLLQEATINRAEAAVAARTGDRARRAADDQLGLEEELLARHVLPAIWLRSCPRRPGPSPRSAGGRWSAAGRCSSSAAESSKPTTESRRGRRARRAAPAGSRRARATSLAQTTPVDAAARAAASRRRARPRARRSCARPGPRRSSCARGGRPRACARRHVVRRPEDDADALVAERLEVRERLLDRTRVVDGHPGKPDRRRRR